MATPSLATPGQQIDLAPYTETQTRPAWFRRTEGFCPGAEIHRRTLNEVILAACPGGTGQWTYHHWDPVPGNPQWGELYCTNPNTGAVELAGTLNDACGAEGQQCEVPFPGFVGKGGLAGAYCEKVTTRCPVGYEPSGGICVVSPSQASIDPRAMCKTGACGSVANAIELYYGNMYQLETDYEGAGSFPLRFERFYNSPNTFVVPLQTDLAVGALGKSIWSHSYSGRIVLASGGGLETAYAWRGDGKVVFFTSMDGIWTPDADISHRLERLTDGSGNPTGWRLITADGERTETYDDSGRLLTIANRAGLTHTLSYNPQGQLVSVSDGLGRSLTFAYTLDGFISTMTDPAGKVYQYAYQTDYRLQSVTYPGGGTRTYHYEVSGSPLLLTGISDENGTRFTTHGYDGYQQSYSSERAGSAARYTVSRPTYAGATSVTVTDPLGVARTYSSEKIMGALRTTGISGPACPDCGPAAMSYDINGNIASRTDWNGNRTCSQYELTRNLEVVRGEGLTAACPTDLASWAPAGGTVLMLVKAVAFLFQKQREVKAAERGGKRFRYIEVAREDIRRANALASGILAHSVDELSAPARTLLGEIHAMVKAHCAAHELAPAEFVFTRRDIRAATGWSDWQVRTHARELEELEYLRARSGAWGKEYVYALAGNAEEHSRSLALTDPDTLTEVS